MAVRGDEALTTVNMFKSGLLARRLNLKNAVAKEKRLDLRRQVLLYQEEHVEGPNPAQILFPEEIWLMIFGKVEDVNSLRNCFNTCHLFRQFLEPIRNLILFRKVLPFLFPFNQNPYDLDSEDILNCRLVSKSLCHLVDDFLEKQYKSWKSMEPFEHRHQAPRENEPLLLPGVEPDYPDHCFNRAVKIHPYYEVYDVERKQKVGGFTPVDFEFTQGDLETYGHHILYLCLGLKPSRTHTRWAKGIERSSVVLGLRSCPNLRSFELEGINRITSKERSPSQITGSVERLQLPYLSTLVLITAPKWNVNQNFVSLQTDLLKAFSSQLKELRVTYWTPEYRHYDWSGLTTLEVQRCDSAQKLESIGKLKANGVKKLSMTLRGRNEKCLKLLFQTINNFPELDELMLQFDSQWKITEEEVSSPSPVFRQDVRLKCLKRLHVGTGYCDQITYSFLLHFPFLENIYISYGCSALELEEDIRNVRWIGHCPKPLLEQEMYLKSEHLRRTEVLELREYLYWNRKNIHQSCVWKILPFLQRITITELWKVDDNACSKTVGFSRSAI